MVKKLHRKKMKQKKNMFPWKKQVARLLVLTAVTGNLLSGMPSLSVTAMEKETVKTESGEEEYKIDTVVDQTMEESSHVSQSSEEKNWYVLGRPMTEEEKAEQRRIFQYYNSIQPKINIEELGRNEVETEPLPLEETSIEPLPLEEVTIEPVPLTKELEVRKVGTKMTTSSMDAIETIPIRYSSREKGYTPLHVESQGDLGICWAMTAIACLETNMIKNGIASRDIDLSENHLVYYMYRPVEDPLGGTVGEYDTVVHGRPVYEIFSGAGTGSTSGPLLAGLGPVKEENFYDYDYLTTYHNSAENHNNENAPYGKLNDVIKAYGNREAFVTDYFSIKVSDTDKVKKAIMEYGAVGVHYNSTGSYNEDFAAQYSPDKLEINHAVAIVGWDDSFPKENFNEEPENNGAWLIRNSWGESFGDSGYFWLSYEDATLDGVVYVFNTASKNKFQNLYHYDRASVDRGYAKAPVKGKIESVNVFEIKNEKELLKAVQLHLMWPDLNYEVQIYKNPTNPEVPDSGEAMLSKTLAGTRSLAGVYTVELDTPIALQKDDVIAVSVTFTSDNENVEPVAPKENSGISSNGQSFFRVFDGSWGEWKDCETEGNFCIRAYTANEKEDTGVIHEHQWEEDYSFNDNSHWKECTGEGTCDGQNHQDREYAAHEGGVAKCNARAICTICQKPYGLLNPTEHGGSKIRTGVMSPTKTQEGYSGDLVCSGCDYIYEEGQKIPKLEEGEENPFLPAGIPNLNYTFQGIDDTPVSSQAQGKPKLLIFFGSGCSHCVSTLNSLTKKTLEGVDICAVDVKFYSKNQVSALKNSLGTAKDDITFCYDEGYDAAAAKLAYETAYNGLTHLSLPVLCYIDAENQIRYLTSGQQTYDEVKGNLAAYCNLKTTNLNIWNPSEAAFQSVDGNSMSLKADGKPKVIVFFDQWDNSIETLESISSKKLPGADIYAYSAITPNEEAMTQLVRTYIDERSGVQGSIDQSSMFEMFKYVEEAGKEISDITYPVICYIDADNRFQHITMGKSSLDAVRVNLMANCGFRGEAEDLDSGETGEENEPEINDFTLVEPERITYFTGEELILSGGKIVLSDNREVTLSTEMVTGFSSATEGEKELTVTYEGITKTFFVLVVEKPGILEGTKEESLSQIELPVSTYGSYGWKDPQSILSQTGEQVFEAVFTPADNTYSTRQQVMITVKVEEKEVPPPVVEEEKYTVSFNYMGKGTDTSVEVKKGEKLERPTDPKAEGYEFKGWYKEEEFTTLWDFEKDVVEGNQTIYAKWEEKEVPPPVVEEEKYTVSFNYMGKGTDTSVEVKKGEKLERPTDPKAEGYEFKGWYKEEEFTTLWDFEKDVVEGNQTIYAKWEEKEVTPPVVEEEKYTVSFNYMGKGTDTSVEVKKGEKLERPTDPKAEEYEFKGWYKEEEFTTLWDFEKDTVTEEQTLYAKWETKEAMDGTKEEEQPQNPDGTKEEEQPQNPDGNKEQDKIETPQVQSMENAVIKLAKTIFNYNGKMQIPNIASVQISGKTLTIGTDYTVSYKNNKNIGTATVMITGEGKYHGTATTTFTISEKKGSKFTVGANTYKVTGTDTVSFTGVKNGKVKKVTIPKKVKIGGKNFKVTSVAAGALKNHKNMTSVTIGKNVKSIGKNAFSGCKKLSRITIKATMLTKVGENALKGIKTTTKIKVPAKKLNAYKNILKGKGQGKKVKIVK